MLFKVNGNKSNNWEFSNVHAEQQCHSGTVIKQCGNLSPQGVILSQWPMSLA